MAQNTDLPDATLVERALAGDRRAFRALVDRHLRPVYGLAFAITGSREESEEVAQETFLRAWRDLGNLRRRESFSAWIGAMARNLAVTGHRSEARRRRTLEALARGRPAAAAPEGEEMEKSEVEASLRQALDRLPEELRTPVVLFYFEEESTVRVAERLGLRPATARKRLQLARDRLREDLLQRLGGALAVIGPGPGLRGRIEAALAEAPQAAARKRARSSTVPAGVASGIILGGTILSAKKLGASIVAGVLVAAAAIAVADPLGWWTPAAGSRPSAAAPAVGTLVGETAAPIPQEPETRIEASAPAAPEPTPDPVKVVTGVVIDARTSMPLEGAALSARWDTSARPVPAVVPGRSGPDGTFRWTVPAKLMGFSVRADGYASSRGTAMEDAEQVIAIDPVLPITGWIVDDEDGPLEGARIHAIESRILGSHGSGYGGGEPTLSSADGSFRLNPPVTGRTLLIVQKPGYGGTIADWVMAGSADVVIRLPRGGRVEGRVLHGPEARAAGARVRWTTVEPDRTSWSGETVSGRDGSFVIEGIPAPGVHLVFLDGVQAPRQALEDGFAGLVRELRVECGETVKELVLDRGLLPELAQAEERRKEKPRSEYRGHREARLGWQFGFWGRVVDPAGRPVRYARVSCEFLLQGSGTTVSTWSDAEGHFEHQDTDSVVSASVNVCQARIMVSHGSFADYRSEKRDVPLPPPTPEGEKVMVGPFEARLSRGFRLTGRVRGPEGEPVGAGVQVYASRSWGSSGYYVSTGADGSFEIEHATPVLRSLVLYHPQAAPLRVPLTGADGMPDGQIYDLGELALGKGATLRGVLLHADGSPAPGFEVMLDEGMFHPVARTDETGRFLLEHLPAGKFSFRISPDGPKAVEIAPNEVERRVELYLED